MWGLWSTVPKGWDPTTTKRKAEMVFYQSGSNGTWEPQGLVFQATGWCTSWLKALEVTAIRASINDIIATMYCRQPGQKEQVYTLKQYGWSHLHHTAESGKWGMAYGIWLYRINPCPLKSPFGPGGSLLGKKKASIDSPFFPGLLGVWSWGIPWFMEAPSLKDGMFLIRLVI